jgi:Coenzyme PQQ synthesis protein D (PqqD)
MVQRNAAILWRELDGEAVLLSPAAGSSYNLNPVGTFIWKLLDGKHSSTDIATAICQIYEVEHEQAFQDVEGIIAELRSNNLVDEVPSPHIVL